jgi:general secretion pathway protein G
MASPSFKKCGGFTLLELALAASLIGVLCAVLVQRLQFYQEQATVVSTQQLLAALRTALQLRAARAELALGEAGLAALAEENPIGWLAQRPKNYLGEFYSPDITSLPAGSWFYDRSDKSLVYILNDSKSFSLETSKFLKFKVKFPHLPHLGRSDGRSKVARALMLDQLADEPAVNR